MTTMTQLPGLLPDLEVIRKDFPILERTMAGGGPLVYLDSANTSQKPQCVIDAMVDHLEHHNANIARAMHTLGAESTEAFEAARDKAAAFLGAPSRDEVIFTKNASEAINLVANTLAWKGPRQIGEGDEVVRRGRGEDLVGLDGGERGRVAVEGPAGHHRGGHPVPIL